MNNDDVFFAIKVDGVSLNEINPADLGLLLHLFSEALGSEGLFFDTLKTGSTIARLKTNQSFADEKYERLCDHINNERKEITQIQDLLNKHPEFEKIHFLKKSANDEEFIDIYTMKTETEDKGMTFWQSEKIRGHLFKLQDGKDKTDHVGIRLEDGTQITMSCSKELSHALADAHAWQSKELVEISGQAKYRYISFHDFKIELFKAESFVKLGTMSVNNWINQFVGEEGSKWAAIEDPINHWLKERHS